MSIAITVENIGKKYSIYHQQREGYTSLRDALTNNLTTFSKKLFAPLKKNNYVSRTLIPEVEDFWALSGVSFEVKQGDRIGIIGRNGAGKSTLLKILSRITEPTTGSIRIKGRVVSLLEVGTGFHPELTGRENIFLNGAILGMCRNEIRSKFDAIVDFSEIERFLDTPVKRYSSGMYVRLAFAVAAHLEPEILIVDEVLAVGDSAFQKKCLGKMGEVGKEGRTVLFVSHNMSAVSTLCSQVMLLDAGKIARKGEVTDVIKYYNDNIACVTTFSEAIRGGSGGIHICNVWLEDTFGNKIDHVMPLQSVYINLEADVDEHYQNGKQISVGFGIDTLDGKRLLTTVSSWDNTEIKTRGEKLSVRCFFPSLPFVPGKYQVSASTLLQMETLDCVSNCTSFEIKNDASFYIHWSKDYGYVSIPSRFEVRYV
jgi:lipopolysaccharide transport system ATP-binding protein